MTLPMSIIEKENIRDNFEVIIADDGSTEDTKQLIELYSSKLQSRKFISRYWKKKRCTKYFL